VNKENEPLGKQENGNDFIADVIASCSRDKIDSAMTEILWKISEIEEHCEDSDSQREKYHLERDYDRLLFAYNSL
jgi:hypothetical protein